MIFALVNRKLLKLANNTNNFKFLENTRFSCIFANIIKFFVDKHSFSEVKKSVIYDFIK